MNENEKILAREVINSYYDGMYQGIYLYAWMKDGTYYVGTTGRTFEEAKKEIENERVYKLSSLKLKNTKD